MPANVPQFFQAEEPIVSGRQSENVQDGSSAKRGLASVGWAGGQCCDESRRDFFYRMSLYGRQITARIDF